MSTGASRAARPWRWVLLAFVCFAIGGAWGPASRRVRAARVLLAVSGEPVPAWLGAPLEVAVEDSTFESEHRPVRARLYAPVGCDRACPSVVLAHGVHRAGYGEPRLVAFARALAGAGLRVLTPELEPLTQYRVEGRVARTIADAARALAARSSTRRVGVVGISFAGGLAVLGAGPPYDGPIAFVVAIGAHHDLRRVVRFFAHERVRGPRGHVAEIAPHPYGARVLLYEACAELFPPEHVPTARAALRAWLEERYPEANALGAQLPEPHRARLAAYLTYGARPEVDAALHRLLLRHAPELLAASPAQHVSTAQIPLFFLHGAADPVVPATETEWLAHDHPAARALVSQALGHADLGAGAVPEQWALVSFMADVLHAADSAR